MSAELKAQHNFKSRISLSENIPLSTPVKYRGSFRSQKSEYVVAAAFVTIMSGYLLLRKALQYRFALKAVKFSSLIMPRHSSKIDMLLG